MSIKHVTALAAFLAVVAMCTNALATPRLLMSYPRDQGLYGLEAPYQVRPLRFVFSEPMDPKSVILPDVGNNNADRSFDLTTYLFGGQVVPVTIAPPMSSVGPAITRDGGLVIELPGSRLGGVLGGGYLHVYRDGFRSLAGAPLDRDYTVGFDECQHCLIDSEDLYVASVPADGQANVDASAPLSIYFGTSVDAPTFQAHLTAGTAGAPVAPLVYHWDLPAPDIKSAYTQAGGFLHLTVDHPLLPATPRPYVFTATQVLVPSKAGFYQAPLPFGTVPGMPAFRIGFTVGPALAGDLNGDGQVTVADAVLTLRAALGFLTLTDAQTFAADLVPRAGANGRPVGDGQVTVADAAYILQRAVGLVADDQWP